MREANKPITVESDVLSAENLCIPASGSLPAITMDLNVRPGELHLIYSRDTIRSTAVVDHLLGLEGSGTGKVRYLDQTWYDLTPPEAFSLRRSVGRVRSRGNWMETRTVMENLLLPLKHHSVLPEFVLREEASHLAQRFGLPGLPALLPEACPATDLQRAACIRAFLGRPALVVLEHPIKFQDSGILEPMINAIQQVRRRQGAVVWFTEHESVVADRSLSADRRYRITGSQLLDLEQPV